MNARQRRKLDSYIVVEALLKAAPETAIVPALPEKVARLTGQIAAINDLGRRQTQPTEGRTAHCVRLHAELAATALEVATAVAAIAHEQRLTELAARAAVSRRDFVRARQLHRPVLAKIIADAASTVQSHLSRYGVTVETLTRLQALIEAANDGKNYPRDVQVTRQGATQRLAELIAETDALLRHQIDRLVYPLRRTHPIFHARYLASRHVIRRRYEAAVSSG